MAVIDLFRPKWQHSKASVRLAAIADIGAEESALFKKLVLSDPDESVRLAALGRIDDIPTLKTISRSADISPSLMEAVEERIDAALLPKLLAAEGAKDQDEHLAGLRLSASLIRVCLEASERTLRLRALERLENPADLLTVAKGQCGKEVGAALIKRLSDPDLLREIAQNGGGKHIRKRAQSRLHKILGPSEEERAAQRRAEAKDICREAERLTTLADPERAARLLDDLQARWQDYMREVDEEQKRNFAEAARTIKERLAAFEAHAREMAALRQGEDEKIQALEAIIQEMEGISEEPGEGQIARFNELEESLAQAAAEVGGLPDSLNKRLKAVKERFLASLNILKGEEYILNKYQRDIARLEENLAAGDLRVVEEGIARIEASLAAQIFQAVSSDDVEQRLAALRKGYEAHQAQVKAEKEEAYELRRQNLAERQGLIEEIRQLDESEDRRQAEVRVKEIQKVMAMRVDLPKGAREELEDSLRQVLDIFFEHQRQFYKAKDWQSWNVKLIQEGLIAEMEALEQEDDLHKVFKEMRNLQEQWRQSGTCAPRESKRLWEMFHAASERQFSRCQAFFAELARQESENRTQKEALIAEAAALKDSEKWQKTTEEYKKLQSRWRAVGRAGKEHEERLYKEFREHCDHFFARRKDHYAKLDAQRQENLQKKEALIAQVEELVATPEDSFHKEIKEIQKKWRTIGPVPREVDEEIWQRFRGVCNRFYQWLDTLRPENLKRKEALCQRLTEVISRLQDDMANVGRVASEVIALQKEWRTIGPAPEEANEVVWQRFKGECDAFFARRKEYFAAIDRARPENEAKKEEIIRQALEAVAEDKRQSVKKIVELQEGWKELGPASKKNEPLLERRFREICNEFFRGRRQRFEELDRLRRETLKSREELLLRLETIAGISTAPKLTAKPGKKTSLTLAEQLKMAMEENFITAGDGRERKRHIKDEVDDIVKRWASIKGEVPKEHIHQINRRYDKALNACRALQRGS